MKWGGKGRAKKEVLQAAGGPESRRAVESGSPKQSLIDEKREAVERTKQLKKTGIEMKSSQEEGGGLDGARAHALEKKG